MLPVILINTRDAGERLDFQQTQFRRLRIPYRRLNAFTPDSLPQDISPSYWTRGLRPMTLGERACFLSHKAAWETVISDGPALIVEDDAVLSDIVPELLRNLGGQREIDHLTLEARGRAKLLGLRRIPAASAVSMRRLYIDRGGAAAYVLWPSGAQKLLSQSDRGAATVDHLLGSSSDLVSYQTDPACAIQLDMLEHYSIVNGVETRSRTSIGDTGEGISLQHLSRHAASIAARVARRLRLIAVARTERVMVQAHQFDI